MTFLHDLDALRAWSHHADANVRRWAVARWTARHPRTDLPGLARLLLDPDAELRRDVALHLARSGEDRWAAVLLKALELSAPDGRGPLIEALGVLAHPSAVPALTDAVRAPREPRELVLAVQALGHHRTDGAWRALTGLLDRLHADDAFAGAVSGALLGLGRRDDLPDLVRRWRGWDDPGPRLRRGFLTAVASFLGADADLVDRTRRLGPSDLGAVLALCARDRALGLPPPLLDALAAAWSGPPLGLLRATHRAVIQLLTARRDDLRTWMDQPDLGRPAVDYRALAIAVEALTGALAAVAPADHRADAERRLALLALLTLAGAEHAERSLASARDPVGTAWRLFRAPRPEVHPAVTEALLATRHRAVPPLLDLLGADVPDAVLVRAAGLTAALTVHGVDATPLAPALVRVVLDRAGQAPAAAAADALVALGPDAVPPIAAAAVDDEPPDELLATLGRLDTEASVQALLGLLREAVVVDPRVAMALADTGSPKALEALSPAWSPGQPDLAALLDALASMHGVDDGQRDGWRRDVGLPALRRVDHADA